MTPSFPRADFVPPPAEPAYGATTGGPWPDPAPAAAPVDQPWPAPSVSPDLQAPVASQGPVPAADRVPLDPQSTRRTPSGLVKRTPRVVDTGEVRALGRGPNDDLLASLSRYTNGRDLTGANPPVRDAPAPPPDTSPFAPPARADSPFTSLPPAGSGGLGGGLAAGLSGLSPFQGSPSSTNRDRGPRPRTAPDAPVPGPPPLASRAPSPDGNGATPGGLTRRVRGAQLPNANPLAVRRGQGAGSPGPAPAAPPRPAARPAQAAALPPESTRSADAVYSFLTSFTAGVQRGLDETRPNGQHG